MFPINIEIKYGLGRSIYTIANYSKTILEIVQFEKIETNQSKIIIIMKRRKKKQFYMGNPVYTGFDFQLIE